MVAWPVLVLTLLAGPHAPARTATFTFPATAGRLNSQLYVLSGEQIKVTASGEWTMWKGHLGLSSALGHGFRVGRFGWGHLMARVGSGTEIAVGAQHVWTSACAGALVFYPHVGRYGVRDGDGTLTLTVEGGRPEEEAIAELGAHAFRVKVPADGEETITDIFVGDREEVRVDAFGEWRMFDGGPLLNADGDLERFLSTGLPWGRLLARFGGPTFATGKDYVVGARSLLRPEQGGLLALRPAVGQYAGHARSGVLDVVVRGGRRATPELAAQCLQRVTDDQRSLAFLRIHEYRHALNLQDGYCSPELMRAAQAHAEYLAQNGVRGHDEEAGKPGFTGATAAERAAAARFDGELVAEAVHGLTDGAAAVDSLWGTVYHRVGLLDPQGRAFGVGVARGQTTAFVLLAGAAQRAPKDDTKVPDVVTFPLDKQTRVPTGWDGREEPAVLPDNVVGPVGYPISVTLTRADLQQVTEAVLRDARGQEVPAFVVAPEADPHKLLRASAFLVPNLPLRALMRYSCQFELVTSAGPQTVMFSFTTGAADTLWNPYPHLGEPASPPIDLGR
ncbi:MAG: hypothetical protein HYU66_28315 [Armatimonadetes bacterium]|nr:hypothetical protein [Armatimonadota bacterium]